MLRIGGELLQRAVGVGAPDTRGRATPKLKVAARPSADRSKNLILVPAGREPRWRPGDAAGLRIETLRLDLCRGVRRRERDPCYVARRGGLQVRAAPDRERPCRFPGRSSVRVEGDTPKRLVGSRLAVGVDDGARANSPAGRLAPCDGPNRSSLSADDGPRPSGRRKQSSVRPRRLKVERVGRIDPGAELNLHFARLAAGRADPIQPDPEPRSAGEDQFGCIRGPAGKIAGHRDPRALPPSAGMTQTSPPLGGVFSPMYAGPTRPPASRRRQSVFRPVKRMVARRRRGRW